MRLKIYGCRGSVAISRPGSRYGGNTSCMLLESDNGSLVMDAGTGILSLWEEYGGNIPPFSGILLSHLHMDHTIGLGTFKPAWNKEYGLKIYTCSRDDRPLRQQICAPFSPPHWPSSLAENGGLEAVEIIEDEPFDLGPFTATAFVAEHSDKTMSFSIKCGDKTIVHLLDSETPRLNSSQLARLAEYCKDADVVVFDAAYSFEDYPGQAGWGHSTVKHGVDLAREWNCKKMIFSHFDQRYNDDELDSWKKYFPADCATEFVMAHDGLELSL